MKVRARWMLLTVFSLGTGCVSASTHRATIAQLAEVQRRSDNEERTANQERQRLHAEIARLNEETRRIAAKLTAMTSDRDTLAQVRDNDVALLSQLKKRLEALGQNLDVLTHEKGALAAGMSDVYARLQELNRQKIEIEQRAAVFQDIAQKLRSMITAGTLDVVLRQGRMVIVMPNDVLFDSGRTDLKPDGRAALGAVAKVLATVPDRRFTVIGHTDDVPIHTPRLRSNWDLSTARAVEVVIFLVDKGLKPENLGAAGLLQRSVA